MDRSKLNSFFGPETLGSIYEGTFEILEENPTPSESKFILNDKIHKITDFLIIKVYNNLESVLKHTQQNKQETQYKISEKDVFSYINYHNNQLENKIISDKSIKKSVDVLLTPLLRLIIKSESYTTTSCCSGRIFFFEKDRYFQDKDNLIFGRSGRILYSSHSHILEESFEDILHSINSNPKHKFSCYKREHEDCFEQSCHISNSNFDDNSAYTENEVILKFEPFIIHVECKNIQCATELLNLCKSVGLKQSGISSYGKKIIMAIRGNGVLETSIMVKKYKIEKNIPQLLENVYLVSSHYLAHLINSCNRKMTNNFYQFIKLYHRLKRELRQLNKYEHDRIKYTHSDPGVGGMCFRGTSSDEQFYDLFTDGKLRYISEFSLPFGVQKPVGVVSFSEKHNNFLRSNCCLTSSKDYVVLYGGYEKATSKTLCLCDLKNIETGFKVFDIKEEGPECISDTTMISDGRAFITFGGRRNVSLFSNDVYLLYVYDDGRGSIDFKWYKCKLEGNKTPKKRFRHSMCLESGWKTDKNVDSDSSFQTRFFVSGGASSCDDMDSNLLGDIWRCTLTYDIENNTILSATVKWECLYENPLFAWSSGSLAHHSSSGKLFIIGGYRNLNDSLRTTGFMNEIVAFDLNEKSMCRCKMRSSRILTNDSTCESESDTADEDKCCSNSYDFPVNTMSHCLVKLTDDEYLLVGGYGSLAFRNEIWYVNLKELVWHNGFCFPSGARFAFGSCLVRYQKGSCKHVELWLIGGGAPILSTYGSVYDVPLRIIMYCDENCIEIISCEDGHRNKLNNDVSSLEKAGNDQEYNHMGMYIVVEHSVLLKKIKNLCEHNGVFDKCRKIVQLNPELVYSFHYVSCEYNSGFALCSRCNSEGLCKNCSCCSSCVKLKYMSQNSCFLVPVLRRFEHNELNGAPTFSVFSNTHMNRRSTQNPRDKLMQVLRDKAIGNHLNVSVLGTSLLITNNVEFSGGIDDVDWEVISKDFNVTSVALVGEIEGEKRKRNVKLLYGSGDVSVKENGVMYNFNVTTNMFSKGNSSERIRIVKMYFNQPEESCGKNELYMKSELIVDLFCGIGYFSIPILRFTDKTKVSKVVCVDVNDEAIKYININVEANKIERSRIETYAQDCSQFGESFGSEYVDRADRILLGLLPNSEVGWIPALRALKKKTGGILHIHGLTKNKSRIKHEIIHTNMDFNLCVGQTNYTDADYQMDMKNKNDCEYFSLYSVRRFYELCKTLSFMKNNVWSLKVLHVQDVKHYSPHMYHQVVDLEITPISPYT